MEPSCFFPQTVTKKENQEQEQQTKRRTEPRAESRQEETKKEEKKTEVQRQEEQRKKERTEQEQLEMEQLMEWSSEGENEGTMRKNGIPKNNKHMIFPYKINRGLYILRRE